MQIAGRGKALEDLIHRANNDYMRRGIAYCDKLETSTAKKSELSEKGHPELKVVVFLKAPRLDYRGFLYAGRSFDFDAKETTDPAGLPLKDIRDNQIDFFRIAKAFNTTSFLVVYSFAHDAYYRVDGEVVLKYWDVWKANPRRRNSNRIPYQSMRRIAPRAGIALDYLEEYYLPDAGPVAKLDYYTLGRYLDRKR